MIHPGLNGSVNLTRALPNLLIHDDVYVVLDGKPVSAFPGTAILIREDGRHCAVGPMIILNVSLPSVVSDDEWFD